MYNIFMKKNFNDKNNEVAYDIIMVSYINTSTVLGKRCQTKPLKQSSAYC